LSKCDETVKASRETGSGGVVDENVRINDQGADVSKFLPGASGKVVSVLNGIAIAGNATGTQSGCPLPL
jgi:hypothetical protein